ncbi:MAG: hypothetical protein U0Q19_00745 [Kineosporiaceae bacterium]
MTGMGQDDEPGWYAVRCVFRWKRRARRRMRTYEERITLWRATSWQEVFARAEAEAHSYAAELEHVAYLEFAQAYRLVDEPGDGAEVFSLLRDSPLRRRRYLRSFFATGTERQGHP